jgi:hypothetical protein
VKLISIQEVKDLNTLVVVLADRSEAPTEWLEIQRSLEFDAQDEDLGMDTYCLVTSAGASRYGGIDVCKLDNGKLEIALSSAAATDLGLDQQLEFDLQAGTAEIAALRNALKRIFENDRMAPVQLAL